MRGTVSKTILSLGPLDEVLSKDISKITGSSGNTLVKDVLDGLTGDALDILKKVPKLSEELSQLVTEAKNGSLNESTALQRLTDNLGGRGGILDKLSTNVSKAVTDSMGGSQALADQILITLKSGEQITTSVQKSSNLSGAQNMAKAIQQLLASSNIITVTDMAAEAALLSGIVGEAIRSGVPQAMDVLLGSAKTDTAKTAIALENIRAVVFSGNLTALEKVTTHLPPESVSAKYPGFAKDFLASFSLAPDDRAAGYGVARERVVTLFESIDPYWDKGIRNGAVLGSLKPFLQASEDALRVFETSPQYGTSAILAKHYKSVEIGDWIKRNYPYFPTA